MASLQSVLLSFYRDYGYVRVPYVFAPDEVEAIRDAAYLEAQERPEKVQWLSNGRPGILLWAESPILKTFRTSQEMQDLVSGFLGPDVRQINNQVYFREAGDGDQFGWHQDIVFRTPPEDFDNVEENYLQTIIAVDPITKDGGAIEFIPMSHKLGDLKLLEHESDPKLRVFERKFWRGEKIEAEPGDVLCWHAMTVHGSEPNVTHRPRMTYMCGFAADRAVVNKDKYPLYLKDGKLHEGL